MTTRNGSTKELALGLNTSYWIGGPPADASASVVEAERLGFDSVWTAESYGNDCLTPLAWWGASTTRMKLGTAIVQMSARAPAATAMAAMTMDHLSQGRFVLGLGVSGPQVVEGWYGQSFAKPLGRTREYIRIVRDVCAREKPVASDGEHYPLPLPGSELGKPLRSNIHPVRQQIPIYLGAEGPKMIALAAELCDGWIPALYSPEHDDFYRAALDEGFSLRTDGRTQDDFEIAATVPFIPADDVETAANAIRPYYALMFGGMGARTSNFHANVANRMGFEADVERIQDLFLAGDKRAAAAAVPLALVEQLALVGPPDKLRDDVQRWRESAVTTILVSGPPETLRTAAEVVLG